MKNELQDYMARPKRYDNIDGTGEMFMGLMILGFALLGYLQTILPAHSMWRTNGIAGLLFMYAVLVPVWGLGFGMQKLIKKKVTWPRTGYVAYGRAPGMSPTTHGDRKIWWTGMFSIALAGAVIAAVLGASLAILMVLGKKHHGALSLARGLYLAFWVPIYAFWVSRMGREQPWKWLVLLAMALGLVVIGLFGPGDFIKLSHTVTLFVGLMWLLSGGATLLSYLRRTQPPVREAE